MAAIEIKNAHKAFGSVRAIDGLDLSIDEGQVCAFLGHNGAGKTAANKAALIRAMFHLPRLLLLDEPTNGLDPISTIELRDMLTQLAKESSATIVLTTHNLEEVRKLCDRICTVTDATSFRAI
jgi:ABC-type multidrug transport system ATPase subunit